jgi:2-polyprenyl-6-methoxyphenol hydroxylase-like FAD-dependent oxidoreductase
VILWCWAAAGRHDAGAGGGAAGITAHVVKRADPADLTAEGVDGRASAISAASWNLFTNIGLADALAPLGCPIDAIAVTDQMKPGRIDFAPSRARVRWAACMPTATSAWRCLPPPVPNRALPGTPAWKW